MAKRSILPKNKEANPLDKYHGLRTSEFKTCAEAEYFIAWAEQNADTEQVATALEAANKELEDLRARKAERLDSA